LDKFRVDYIIEFDNWEHFIANFVE